MDEKTYIGHVANLASDKYHTNVVPEYELDYMLRAAKAVTQWADLVKRGLFYGTDVPLRGSPSATSVKHDPKLADLVHGVVGLFTEAGELIEHLHDVLTGKKELDRVNLIEEMGDAHWYLALLHKFNGTTPSQTWDINIAKLRQRFPDKFTQEAAQHEARDLYAEREVLKQLIKELDADIADSEANHG